LRAALRTEDVVGRWGGDEFLAVLAATDVAGATTVAERICAAVAARPVSIQDADTRLTVSVGCASGAGDPAALIRQAGRAARRAGGVAAGGGVLVPRLALLDDGGTAKGLRHALDLLARADVLIGPYGSGLTREAGDWAAERGRVIWNHGGSADEVEMQPWLVSIASPTSRYLTAVIDVVAGSLPGGRVLVGAGTGSFGRAAARGAGEAAAAAGLSA